MASNAWSKNLLENPPNDEYEENFNMILAGCSQLGNSHVDMDLMNLLKNTLKHSKLAS